MLIFMYWIKHTILVIVQPPETACLLFDFILLKYFLNCQHNVFHAFIIVIPHLKYLFYSDFFLIFMSDIYHKTGKFLTFFNSE